MADILVCGYGYLGSHLVADLKERGHRVAAASKHGSGEDCLEADLSQLSSIDALAAQLDFSPEWVVHCASSSRGGEDVYRQVFVEGIKNLTAAFPEATIMLTSSTSVYPHTDGSVVDEDTIAEPDRRTGQYLRQAEELLLDHGGIVLRLAGIYGPDRSVHYRKMLEGTATIESGDISRWLNQIHRDDAASAITHLIESPAGNHRGQIYNVADDTPISQRHCYEQLATILDKPIPPEAAPDLNRKRAWTHKQVANAKLKATGWQPQWPSFLEAAASWD